MQEGKILKTARLLAGLRQKDLAEKVQVSRSLIGMIEQGRRKVKPYLAQRLSKILGVNFGNE